MVSRTAHQGPEATPRQPRSDSRATSEGVDTLRALRAAWRRIEEGVPELKDDLVCYATVKVDQARLAAARTGRRLVRGIAIGTFCLALLVTSGIYVIEGVAGGLAVAFDGRTWLANLVTGVGVIMIACFLVAARDRAKQAKRLRRLERRYARHDARQRRMQEQTG